MTALEVQQQTKDLIDRLKSTTNNNGLGNSGHEYTVIVETFLYKFLNDKFVYQAKLERPEIADAEDPYKALLDMSEDDYEELCDEMMDTVILEKEHLLPYLSSRQNEDNFAKIFDATLEGIAKKNESFFFIQDDGNAHISIIHPISDLVSGSSVKKNAFCKSLIGDISAFSFEKIFDAGYDFFSTIFEYLLKDYNSNGGGTYAEYYTPHSVAQIIAKLLVGDNPNLKSMTCYDPAAGTGTLVIALAHSIGEQKCSVYTQDISDKSSTMMMLNLILNGMSHSLTNVIKGNTLLHPFHKEGEKLKQFDYVVSNPPFKLDFSDYQSDLKNDPNKGRFFAGIPNIPKSKKSSMEIYLCFLQHVLYSIKDGGKGAIVVPTGFLTAQSGIAQKIKQYLVDNRFLKGVISMPSNIFANTGTNVSVVFIDKTALTDTAVLIDASKLGETIKDGKNQKTVLNTDDINKIIEAFAENKAIEDFSVNVKYDEIKEKNYSLSAGQYFEIKIEYVELTQEEFNQKISDYTSKLDELFKEGNSLEAEIKKSLNELIFKE